MSNNSILTHREAIMKYSSYSNIVICGDILCTRPSEQNSNNRWLIDLLSTPILEATGKKPLALSGEGHFFSRTVFFSKTKVLFDSNKIHMDFDISKITPESIEYLRNCFANTAILIGYEISLLTREILHKADIKYIDIWLHPVRFLDDILFGFRSSVSAINSSLKQFDYNSAKIQAEANLIKIQSYRGFNRFEHKIPENSALFVGQTIQDKAILHKGDFLNVLNYPEQFSKLAKKYKKVFYSRHPFIRSGDESILRYLKTFENVESTKYTIYHLLAHPNITRVSTISSSVAQEAKYFGKSIDVWFRPAFENDGNNSYYKVMHSFCFAHFWSKILASITETKDFEIVTFDTGKNKLRDSMSFYWGYKDINKFEHYLKDKNNLPASLEEPAAPVFDAQAHLLEKDKYADLIDKYEIISFDIFDTLLQRDCFSPKDIFRRVAIRMYDTSALIEKFVDLRISAEGLASKAARSNGRSDPTISEIYKRIHTLSEAKSLRAMNYEIEEEEKALHPRPIGKILYNYAHETGKKVVLVSDMYLSKKYITNFLTSNGFTSDDNVFVSVDSGCSKRNGALFKHLIQKNVLKSGHTLHIGDNPNGDVEQALACGLDAAYIPNPSAVLRDSHPFMKAAAAEITLSRNLNVSNTFATLSQQMFENFDVLKEKNVFLSSPSRFGAVALAPLIFGFTSWTFKMARDQNIKHLVFLARDSKLFYDAFNILREPTHKKLQVSYLNTSRRMMRCVFINNVSEAKKIGDGNILNVTLFDWIKKNFDVCISNDDFLSFIHHDSMSPDLVLNNQFDRNYLKQFIEHIWAKIESQVKLERDNLKSYLIDNGLNQEGCALVDIGYAGTTQKAISTLLDTQITGYYVVTSKQANNQFHPQAPMFGYVGNKIKLSTSKLGVAKYRFLYESVLCEASASAKSVHWCNGSWVVSKQENVISSEMKDFIIEAHSSCIEIIEKLKKSSAIDWETMNFSPNAATAVLDNFFKAPSPSDARLMKALSFDDIFGFQGARSFITSDTKISSHAIWREGQKAILPHQNPSKIASQVYGIFGWRKLYTPIVAYFVNHIGGERQRDVYLDNPGVFFSNLEVVKYQKIGRILYPNGGK